MINMSEGLGDSGNNIKKIIKGSIISIIVTIASGASICKIINLEIMTKL